MAFAYNPFALTGLLTGAIALAVGIFIWLRRPGRGVDPALFLAGAVAIWSVGSSLEILGTNLLTKHILTSLTYIGIVLVPAAWLLFVLEYTGRDAWLTRRTLALLCIHPLATVTAATTNPLHHLYWRDVVLDVEQGVAVYLDGPLFWVHASYAYLLLLWGAVLLLRAFARSPGLYRGQITLLSISTFFPFVANALYITDTSPLPPYIDPTPIAFTLTGITVAYSLYRFRLMDLMPVAHSAIFKSMADAVLVFDLKQRVIEANAAASYVLGTLPTAIVGKTASEIFDNQPAPAEHYLHLRDAVEDIELSVEDGAADPRIYQVRSSALRDRDGITFGHIVVLHDISERERANRELDAARIQANEAARLKSEFLAAVSHELRTPINAILGQVDLLKHDLSYTPDDTRRDPIERVEASGRHLLGMISDILDLSQMDAGCLSLQAAPITLYDLVDEWRQNISVLADQKGLTLQTQVEPGFPVVIYADAQRLSQIAINLLANAVKFTDAGGITLEIRTLPEARWLLQVRDTGIGIPPAALAFIFDEFRQVDGSAQRRHGGTGLGLAIVQKLVTLMDGTIQVESEVQVGSTFSVQLPLRIADHAVAVTSKTTISIPKHIISSADG